MKRNTWKSHVRSNLETTFCFWNFKLWFISTYRKLAYSMFWLLLTFVFVINVIKIMCYLEISFPVSFSGSGWVILIWNYTLESVNSCTMIGCREYSKLSHAISFFNTLVSTFEKTTALNYSASNGVQPLRDVQTMNRRYILTVNEKVRRKSLWFFRVL